MANRIKDFSLTATAAIAADAYLAIDGVTNNTQKILCSLFADYVANEEGGSTLASLSGGKVPTAQLPWTGETFLGTSTVASLPAPGGLSAGEYYITTDSGTNHSVTFAAGDKAISDGTSYYAVADGVRPIGEGGTGASTAEGARTNLEVDSKDQIAEGLTRNAPSLYLDGNGDYISVAHDSGLAFGDGSVDKEFSMTFWLRIPDLTPGGTGVIAEKSQPTAGWWFLVNSSGKLEFHVASTSNKLRRTSSAALTTVVSDGDWFSVSVSLDGAGTGYSNTLQNTLDSLVVYINAEPLAMDAATATVGSKAGYESDGGRSDDGGPLQFGGFGASSNLEFELRNVQIFNTALSAADVETIYRSGVPFELDQASATAIYESDFTSDSTDSHSVTAGITLDATLTIGSDSDNLALVDDGSTGTHRSSRSSAFTPGKQHFVSFEYYIPSGNTTVDGIRVGQTTLTASGLIVDGTTTDEWTRQTATFGVSPNSQLYIAMLDGSSTTFTGTSGDKVYIRNIVVKEAGCILDLEIGSTNGTTVPDRSGNGFNGSLNSMTVAGNLVGLPSTLASYSPNPSSGQALLALGNGGSGADFSVDEDWTGVWTPAISYSGGSTGITYGTQSGYYSKVGNVCLCVFRIVLTNKGTDSGSVTITGLPFSAKSTGYRAQSNSLGYYANMSGLTGAPITAVNTGSSIANLSQFGAASIQDVTNANLTNTSDIRGTITYITD